MASSSLRAFPLLAEADPDSRLYRGFLSFQGQDFPLEIRLHDPCAPTMRDAKLYACPELKRMVAGLDKAIQQRLDQCSDVASFLVDFKDLLERTLPVTNTPTSPASPTILLPSPIYYTALLAELDSIGWHHIHNLSPTLSEFSIQIIDNSRRTHALHVRLPSSYPSAPAIITVDLPTGAVAAPTHRLADAVEHYRGEVERYADLWACLEDLDDNTWRLEPERPGRGEEWRRISLGNHCSLHLTLNPTDPRGIPDTRFFGAESRIAPLRNAMTRNLHLWSRVLTPRANLELLLGVPLPTRAATAGAGVADADAECGICYGYRDEAGAVPDRECANPRCARGFHRTCLVEWLRAIPSTRQSFDTLFGTCPYCNEPMTTTIGEG